MKDFSTSLVVLTALNNSSGFVCDLSEADVLLPVASFFLDVDALGFLSATVSDRPFSFCVCVSLLAYVEKALLLTRARDPVCDVSGLELLLALGV